MADYAALKQKVDQLSERDWDVAAIEARVKKMVREGIPRRKLNPKEILANKQQILDRVQLRAEEYNFFLKNCPQGTALALMEEFDLGNMEIIKALTPFPGIGGTGRICGGITGSLINLGLYFGSDNPPEPEKVGNTIKIAQQFIALFEERIGYLHCADIIEKVTIGQRVNPGESEASMNFFAEQKGFEKCGLLPGTGVRIAAELIIDSMK